LHLTEADFWNSTLAQIAALSKRYREQEERLDFRTGQICAILANIYRDHKRKSKPFTPQDFMPQYATIPKKQTSEEMLATVKIINQAFGGKVKKLEPK